MLPRVKENKERGERKVKAPENTKEKRRGF